MELNYIKEFVLLANINNFQEAADTLYISQSTLTRHIQALEKELQNRLFDRNTRSVQLSEFGKFFLPYAQELVCIERDFQDEFYKINKQPYEIIRIGAIPAMAPYRFTDVLAHFQNAYPSYRLEITEINRLDSLSDELLRHVLDFALIHEPDNLDPHLNRLPFISDRLVAILPEDHPLSGHATVSLLQLSQETFLTMPLNSIVSQRFLAACKRNSFTPGIGYCGHKEDVILSLAQNHFGIGVLPRTTAEYTRHDHLALVDIIPAIPLPLSLVYSDSLKITTGKQLFLNACQEIALPRL